ncbi:hypothetical protein KKA03_05420 [archaeon]|nr:hypothetical protein [archaeon]
MKKATIGAAALLIIAAAALILAGGNDTPAKGTYLTAPPAHTTSAPKTTQAPATTAPPATTTVPAETPEPVEEYVNAALGGTFGPGDKISYLGVEGIIKNGEVITSPLEINNEQGKTILFYSERDNPTYGHLELISYPQKAGERHSVVMKQNNKDTGVCLKYDSIYNFNNYVRVVFESEDVSEGIKVKLLC